MAMTLDGTNGITQMTGSIVMSGSTSGTTTIIPSAVAGTTTVTMPAATGTMMVSGNMPAFRVGLSASQTGISSGVFTKITFNSKSTAGTYWDTNGYFDATTNYRFTPLVAGYYQINLGLDAGTTTACTRLIPVLYKNGSLFSNGLNGSSTQWYNAAYSDIVYLNGTTDYIEAYCYILGTSPAITNSVASFFSGSMVRGA